MDILNKKERFSAFTLFLLMFVITTGVLIFALFYNYRLPIKENEVLRAENEKNAKKIKFEKVFTDKIIYVEKLVDSIDMAPDKFTFLEQDIKNELNKLNSKSDSLEDPRMYKKVVLSFLRLVEAKGKLTKVNDVSGSLEKLEQEVVQLRSQNQSLSTDLKICNSRLN
jgi:hypothetical protein